MFDTALTVLAIGMVFHALWHMRAEIREAMKALRRAGAQKRGAWRKLAGVSAIAAIPVLFYGMHGTEGILHSIAQGVQMVSFMPAI